MKTLNQKSVNQLLIKSTTQYPLDYVKFRAQSAPESKLGLPKIFSYLDIEIKEIHKLAEKLKWMSWFRRGYAGEASKLKLTAYNPAISKIFVAEHRGKELGFIRITNKTETFKGSSNEEVWNIAEIYVKPAYRGNAIASQLMHYVLKNHSVKSILLETNRYREKKYYFNRIGFTFEVKGTNFLSRIFISEFEPVVRSILSANHTKI